MTRVRAEDGGRVLVEAAHYRLDVAADGLVATLSARDGEHLASLRLLAAFDCMDGRDETLSVAPPAVVPGDGVRVEIERRSTRWEAAGVRLACQDGSIEVSAFVRGRGRLGDVHLLAGRSLVPGKAQGFLPSGSSFRTLFSANPGDPGRLVRSAAETAAIGIVGDSQPGRGHWFFSPAPLYLALTRADGVADPGEPVAERWTTISLEAPVEELTFVELAYQPADRGFSLRLDYDGHTEVDGELRAPSLVLRPGVPDPYAGLRAHRAALVARGAAPAARPRATPSWWSEPIFCGWGAQCALAAETGEHPASLSTQAAYDAFLERLEEEGLVPGTVVIDDKWQHAYGTCEPDRVKWPGLEEWIAARQARGQRVLLWWKAWDPEGLPGELCVRNPDGLPVALDPAKPGTRAALGDVIARMLARDGLGADGLKIDFTSSSAPCGSTQPRDGSWGIALLHELLEVVYAAAKHANEDALIVTHTPHPAFADVTDTVRLNDMLRLDDPGPRPQVVPQMRYRAEVVRAASPEVLIETDDWCAPDLASWREFQKLKPELGVPSLYYATHLDLTGERLEPSDYELVRRIWAEWRASRVEAVSPA